MGLSTLFERAGIGGIIRNSLSYMLLVFASKIKAAHSIEAELQALVIRIDMSTIRTLSSDSRVWLSSSCGNSQQM